jgi:hypothetical protein
MEKMNTPDWRTLTPGKSDSDLYTEQAAFNEDDLTWWDGRNVGGITIGLVQFRANLPMMPGNMGNATTFDFPILYREMNADSIFDIMAQEPTENFTGAAIEAAKWGVLNSTMPYFIDADLMFPEGPPPDATERFTDAIDAQLLPCQRKNMFIFSYMVTRSYMKTPFS